MLDSAQLDLQIEMQPCLYLSWLVLKAVEIRCSIVSMQVQGHSRVQIRFQPPQVQR